MKNRLALASTALGAVVLASSASACMVQPPPEDPPWLYWQATKSQSPLGPNYVRQSLYMNVGLFANPASDPMNCACGIGITGAASWVASGLIQSASVKLFEWVGDCATGSPGAEFLPFSDMPFGQSASDQFAGYFGTAGDTSWFGFSGVVQPFVPPADKKWVVCFSFDVHESIDELLKNGRKGFFAAGVADSNLNPDFNDPLHPVVEINSAYIPAPGALSVLALAGVVGARRRRR